ncbi:ricin B lectin domain-containing protein [Rhizoctonia solani]|nr:ricin B lectin domain-containing protein [Rhizoctonia solani]
MSLFPSTGLYRISNFATDTVADSYGGQKVENNPVNGYKPHGGANQKWLFDKKSDDGQYTIRNDMSGMYLAYADQDLQDGIQVVTRNTSKLWRLIPGSQGWIIAAAQHDNFVLDMKESSSIEGTPVHLWTKLDALNQNWILIPH